MSLSLKSMLQQQVAMQRLTSSPLQQMFQVIRQFHIQKWQPAH